MADPILTWNDVLKDNGTPQTRPMKTDGYHSADNGVYPFGLPRGYSWYLGGESWLGSVDRMPSTRWKAMTAFHLVYPEAVSAGGAAKPTVVCNVNIRKYRSWVHFKARGWKETQSAPPDVVNTGRFDGPQTGNQASALNVIANPDGSFTEPAPPPGWCNHGWIRSRGSFNSGEVDGAFSYFEMKADKPGANLVAASGMDWWESNTAPFPNNTGYSMSCWKRLTTDWIIITGSSLLESLLRVDPPPPLVGVTDGGGTVPPPEPVAAGIEISVDGKPLAKGSTVSFKIS